MVFLVVPKALFFEKTIKKRRPALSRAHPESSATARPNVFWLFFSKKNFLPLRERDPTAGSRLGRSDRALASVFASIFVRRMVPFGRTMP
jgi:hypothetical protein